MNNNSNKKILENVKLKISISNFNKEEKRKMNKSKKSIFKFVAAIVLALISITGVVFAKDIGLFFEKFFGGNASDGVETAVNNGYVVNVKTEYQEADGIEISIDSILMDDFNFDMNFNIKVNDKYELDGVNGEKSIHFDDLKVIDETDRIVFNSHVLTAEKIREGNDEGYYMGGYGNAKTKINENEYRLAITATGSPIPFPKSKKLIIDFTKIRTWEYIGEESIETIYTGSWHFEIDVPEEFYNREAIIYKAKSCSETNININEIQAVLSKTALKISIPEIDTDKVNYEALHSYDNISIYNMIALQKEYVETSDGKRFEPSQRSDGDGGYSLPPVGNKIIDYHQTFNLTSFDATDNITIHIFTNKGEEIKIELERYK